MNNLVHLAGLFDHIGASCFDDPGGDMPIAEAFVLILGTFSHGHATRPDADEAWVGLAVRVHAAQATQALVLGEVLNGVRPISDLLAVRGGQQHEPADRVAHSDRHVTSALLHLDRVAGAAAGDSDTCAHVCTVPATPAATPCVRESDISDSPTALPVVSLETHEATAANAARRAVDRARRTGSTRGTPARRVVPCLSSNVAPHQMDSAVAGAVGAVAGALLGGGGKILQEHLGHRLSSRTGARILHNALDDVERDIASIVSLGTARTTVERWPQALTAWDTHQEALARILSVHDFDAVAEAFKIIVALQEALSKYARDETVSTVPEDLRGILGRSGPYIRDARNVLHRRRLTYMETDVSTDTIPTPSPISVAAAQLEMDKNPPGTEPAPDGQ